VSRRAFLTGAAGLVSAPVLGQATSAVAAPAATTNKATAASSGTATTSVATASAAPATTTTPLLPAKGWSHAVGDPRGSDLAVAVNRSKQGRFGLMFPSLAAFAPADNLLNDLATQMIDPTPPLDDVSLSSDGFDNPDIPAGYTYLGQFIDHDMTHDTTDLTAQQVDPHGLTNFDTPFFDLGSVYGRGPSADPQLYDPANPGMLLIGGTPDEPDLPRAADGTAYLGDPRNDENLIVAQIQLSFLKLHNSFIAAGQSFTQAQQSTRWHFQWVIVNDFLPRIVGQDLVASMLLPGKKGTIAVDNRFYKPTNPGRPMMPIEYSAAAYRFGHSMIRAEYEVHDSETLPVFGPEGGDLRGSRPLPAEARIDWNYFFEINGIAPPDDRNLARMIDTKLALPLSNLPPTVVAHVDGAILALAQRNLLRGKRLGLPAGQDVAKAMGVAPIDNSRLGLSDPAWGGKAPLWFYILKEAELLQAGRRLGPVGARLVAEVILGLLATDPNSYFNAPGGWAPATVPFAMGDLLLLAGVVQPEPPETEATAPEAEAAAPEAEVVAPEAEVVAPEAAAPGAGG
jgi:hypothetical protein